MRIAPKDAIHFREPEGLLERRFALCIHQALVEVDDKAVGMGLVEHAAPGHGLVGHLGEFGVVVAEAVGIVPDVDVAVGAVDEIALRFALDDLDGAGQDGTMIDPENADFALRPIHRALLREAAAPIYIAR